MWGSLPCLKACQGYVESSTADFRREIVEDKIFSMLFLVPGTGYPEGYFLDTSLSNLVFGKKDK